MKSLLLSLSLVSFLVLNACGGGGGMTGGNGSNTNSSSSGGTSAAPTVKITGQLSDSASAKPSEKIDGARAISSWTGATLKVVDTTGKVLATGTVLSTGSYSATVSTGSDYFIRAQIGNLVLKAFVPTVSADMVVNLNPTSTAEFLALASIVGLPNTLGDPNYNGSAAFSPTLINITAVITQIQSKSSLTTLADAIASEISSGYNASATTPSLGSASVSASVSADVAAVATGIVLLPTTGTGAVAAINITPLGATLGTVGNTVQFTATAVDSYGKTVSGVTITWATSDGTVATVSNTGLVTAVGTGSSCTITATGGGKTGSVAVDVGTTVTITVT
jgi:hypothetical protein